MLSPELKRSLDRAITDTRRRRHEFITLEHLLYALIDDETAKKVLLGCGADLEALRHELETFLDETMAQVPDEEDVRQTIAVGRVLQRAVLHVQGAGKPEVTGANLLVSLFAEDESFAVYLLLKQKIRRSDVTLFISHGIGKNQKGAPKRMPGNDADDGDDTASDDPLSAYCVDLLAKAAKGNIDTLVGRDDEITRAVQILCRRRKNNPVLVGEPGVGKTAIVEGLALRIHEGKVPTALADAKIYGLDMGSLLAGTKFRGQFEERVKAVVDAILELDNAILFIDEIHTVVGAGATSGGSMDASNLLKPKLNSGELRCIGATTFKEFKTSFEKDPALARRFQKLEVIEPSIEESILILQGLKPLYEDHHVVEYTHAAIEQCVRLAHKHLRDRRLPDSAIDVLDETGAAMRLRADDTAESADDVSETAANPGDPEDAHSTDDEESSHTADEEARPA
ncbi:MAG: Clp protease N-terminal domain-containing protein, partial [Nannocystaceae bacterium]